MTKIEIDMTGDGSYELPEDLVDLLKTADVTNITERIKILSTRMFEEMTPEVISKIQNGVQKGIDGIQSGITEMDKSNVDLNTGVDKLTKQHKEMLVKIADTEAKRNDMLTAISSIESAKADMNDTFIKMTALKDAVPKNFQEANNNYIAEIDKLAPQIELEFQSTMNEGFKQVYLTTGIAGLIAMITLIFYRTKKLT
jgi:predicted nuclease with TOPRIM domain